MTLFDRVKSLNLSAGDFAIFGSGPLVVRGIIPASNDLDILCRRQAWKTVQKIGDREYLSDYDVTIVTMCDGRLTFGTQWGVVGCCLLLLLLVVVVVGRWLLLVVVGCWLLLVVGCWLLVWLLGVGCWLLVVGCWFGCWFLVVGY